jgi:NodT family efflux transporter outer membrane factor (OMF) lipoprotein
MRRLFVSIFCSLLIFSLMTCSGCKVGPKYSRPETIANSANTYVSPGIHNQDVNDIESVEIDKWWVRFGDSVTSDLVRRALGNNYDLKAAVARVLQAQASLAEARGRLWPDVSYGLNRDRSKRSLNLGAGPFGGRFSIISETWTQDISVTYLVDLFGKLRHAKQAAWAEVFAAEANRQALVNSIIATVIRARIDIATTQKRLAIAKANTQSYSNTLEIVERRYSTGLVGPVDVRLARENLEASKALEPNIELSLLTARHGLDVLLARQPGAYEDLPDSLADLPDLEHLPIGVPALLLDRRPDVISAEFALRAANERIGVSIAQLYPDLTLTASYGASADRWRDIWEHFAETYSALFNLAQPIFRGGQLRAQVDAAKARYEELTANYASVVLTAMREVEDALVGEEMLQIQLEHAQRRFVEAKAAEELSKERYQRGVEGILTVLESERRRRISEEELAVLKGQIWTTRVNLHLALGGDWEKNESEVYMVKDNGQK